MAEDIIDAKTAVESSPTANGDVKTATDSSSVETQVQESTDAKDTRTIADVAKEAFDKGVKEEAESSTAEDEAQKGDVQELNKTEDANDKEDVKGTEETDEKVEELPPFHEHPRWKEVVSDRDKYKADFERVKPVVEAHENVAKFCQDNGISQDDYKEGLQMLALSKTNPMAFYDKLKKAMGKMAPEVGDTLPADLQKAVDDGDMTIKWAQELAKTRAKDTLQKKTTQLSVEQRAAQAQKQFVQSIQQSLATWENTVKEKDPDFLPKASESDPDGKFEWWADKFSKMVTTSEVKTPQDAVMIAVKALEIVNKSYSRFTVKNGTRKVIPSTKSSSTKAAEPKSIADVVKATAAKHGLAV